MILTVERLGILQFMICNNITRKKEDNGNYEGSSLFWTMLVWSYKDNAPKVLDITQGTILKAVEGLIKNQKWGDPRRYDLNINREGTGRTDTKYIVTPSPHGDYNDDITEFIAAVKEDPGLVQLSRIWEGKYPFEAYNW